MLPNVQSTWYIPWRMFYCPYYRQAREKKSPQSTKWNKCEAIPPVLSLKELSIVWIDSVCSLNRIGERRTGASDRGVAPVAPLLQDVRALFQYRLRGSFVTYIAMEFEEQILRARVPLKVRYNNSSTIIVVPIGLCGELMPIYNIHEMTFVEMYGQNSRNSIKTCPYYQWMTLTIGDSD